MGKPASSAMVRVGARLRAHREAAGLTQIMSFSDRGDVAYSEDPVSGRFVEEADTVRRYAMEYETIRDSALPVDASLKFIRQVREAL